MEGQVFRDLPGIVTGGGDFHPIRHIPAQPHIGFQLFFHEKALPEVCQQLPDGLPRFLPAHGKNQGAAGLIQLTVNLGDADLLLYAFPDEQPQLVPLLQILTHNTAAYLDYRSAVGIPLQGDVHALKLLFQLRAGGIFSEQ